MLSGLNILVEMLSDFAVVPNGPTNYAFVPRLRGEWMIGPQKNMKPSEAAPVTVQVGMGYFYRLRRGKVWIGTSFGSSRVGVGCVTRTKRQERQRDKREKLKLKQAGVK